MRQTQILCHPLLSLEVSVFADCCEPLLEIGLSQRYLRESFPRCLDPYPGSPHGALTRFFPWGVGLPPFLTRSALSNSPHNDFSAVVIFGAAVIH